LHVARRQPARLFDGDGGSLGLRSRLIVCSALGLVVVVSAAVPAVRFDGWQWWALGLTALMVAWGAKPFHQEAWVALREGTADVATLVSASTFAGVSWSLAVLLQGGATGPVRHAGLFSGFTGSDVSLTLAAAAGITWLALAGRYGCLRSSDHGSRLRRHFTEVRTTPAGADRAAGRRAWATAAWVPATVALLAAVAAAAALGFWLAASDDVGRAAGIAVTVLLVASAGGLLWAEPLVAVLGSRRAAQLGCRVADRRTMAVAQRVDTVVLNTASSLTTDHPRLLDIATVEGTKVTEVLERVGTLGQKSDHPGIKAIVASAHSYQLGLGTVEVVADTPGHGVRGIVDGRPVAVGGQSFLGSWAAALPGHLARTKAAAEAAGRTTMLAGWDGAVRALIVLAEPVRPEAQGAIAEMKACGLQPLLVTACDERDRAASLAGRVGIDDVVVVQTADEADSALRWLSRGRTVATLDGGGPGLPTQGGADIDIRCRASAVASGETGHPDRSSDLWSAVDALRFSRVTGRILKQNRLLALLMALPALGLAATGNLSTLAAVAVIVGSVVPVALNSLRITRVQSARPPGHRLTAV
jgi:Cu+-exporting ATPase